MEAGQFTRENYTSVPLQLYTLCISGLFGPYGLGLRHCICAAPVRPHTKRLPHLLCNIPHCMALKKMGLTPAQPCEAVAEGFQSPYHASVPCGTVELHPAKFGIIVRPVSYTHLTLPTILLV